MRNELLEAKINQLRTEKKAVILAHYYQVPEIQDIADFVGDSLDLSRKSAETNAEMIVFAGVHFMAETAKILSPKKKVLLPDLEAGCSLADSCPADDFKKFREKFPDHLVVSYVNTTAEIKVLTDITCTSTNALQIINSIPPDQPIIFAPDRNLGNYLNSITGRNMKLWDGACHVHEEFSLEKIMTLLEKYPGSKTDCSPGMHQANPNSCRLSIGSTSALLRFVDNDNGCKYIVATESGILHQMKRQNPYKNFIPAPPIDSTCGCNDCRFMKLHNLQKIYESLRDEKFEIMLTDETIKKAVKPIQRMLELSL